MKFSIKTEPTNVRVEDRLTFGDDPIADTDSGSLFYFPHPPEISLIY